MYLLRNLGQLYNGHHWISPFTKGRYKFHYFDDLEADCHQS